MDSLKNKRICDQTIIEPPAQILKQYPITPHATTFIAQAREQIDCIVRGEDHRLLVICGPCSLHDIDAAKEYALRLRDLHWRYQDTLYITMRAYFEKPRTRVGWKGMINDPMLDGSFAIEDGIKKARSFLAWLAELGLPAATEALDHIIPQYISDLISWVAIGARTIESQTHREMASGLSACVGFKNGTDGNLTSAINAMDSARHPHAFLGITEKGQVAVMHTSGNDSSHLILRGGKEPNYDTKHVAQACHLLQEYGLRPSLMIDCSHDNSNKDFRRQGEVLANIQRQIKEGNESIIGVMLESNLHAGKQRLTDDVKTLKYGVSITDGCIDWEETQQLLEQLYHELRTPLKQRLGTLVSA